MILSIVAGSFLIPVAVAVYLHEWNMLSAFFIPMAVLWPVTLLLFIKTKRQPVRLTVREGIFLVSAAWLGAGLLGAVPFMLSGFVPHFSDAFFESVSGFTTTGASALENIESYPMALRVWRTQMHWLGGMGIVALTVALFPLLGVGGFQLIKSETSGPDKGKVTAKITHTAKALWFIYLGMTVLQIILLCIAGMPFLEAMCHSFSTLGTGGFSTQNTSVGYYNSASIEIICTVFMFLAGVNFSLYFHLFTGKPEEFFRNSELRAYIRIALFTGIGIALVLVPVYGLSAALRHSFFHVASIMTTTGASALENIESYPMALRVWRTQMHWLGGMGIVALTVALFPLLGVGGFQLIKSETSGPDKGKVTAKITHTAKALWFIYLGMTVLQILLLCLADMPFLEAMCHSFSTLGTGGFSTQNNSIGYYNSAAI